MSGDNSIKMWRACGLLDTASGGAGARPSCRLLMALTAHTKGVYTLALSPDGKTLFSGGEDSDILVWSVDGSAGTGQLIRSLEEVCGRWGNYLSNSHAATST